MDSLIEGILYLTTVFIGIKLLSGFMGGVNNSEYLLLLAIDLYIAIAAILNPGYKQYLWEWLLDLIKGLMS